MEPEDRRRGGRAGVEDLHAAQLQDIRKQRPKSFGTDRICNVGALIIRIGFWGLLIISIVLYSPKPYSDY